VRHRRPTIGHTGAVAAAVDVAARLPSEWTLLGRVAVAALAGMVVGYERELRGRAAGYRTFALMVIGAAAFTASGQLALEEVGRVIAGIATGVGFIGAGVVWRGAGHDVHGLTTATAMWAMVAVGVVAGMGALLLALAITALVLMLLEWPYIPLLKQIDPSRTERVFKRDTDPPDPPRSRGE
jgi:putative Mg2+ transporter-C (MgtC) family protein